MTNYRELLRLQSLGLNKTEIAASLHCARNTVAATLQRAGNCGLQWPLPDEMSDRQLADRLFPSAPGKPVYKMPDYAYVYKEMQKSGVTLNLLWLEYCDQCKASGEIPYQSTQFNKVHPPAGSAGGVSRCQRQWKHPKAPDPIQEVLAPDY